jgi:hypothetical protein
MKSKKETQLLRLLNLPVFSTIEELSSLLHIEVSLIKILSNFSYRYYRKYKIPKPNGEFREIKQPCKKLKAIQAWILRNILDTLNPSPNATAYIKKKKLLDNVTPHNNNRYFLCLDLEDFFPSISINRVAKVFSLIGYSGKAVHILANLCTCDNNLPQGAVTSPSLSNLIAAKLDRRILGYTSRKNITYTRYADDITLSANNYKVLCKSLQPDTPPKIFTDAYSIFRSQIPTRNTKVNYEIKIFYGKSLRNRGETSMLIHENLNPKFLSVFLFFSNNTTYSDISGRNLT